MRRGRDVDDGEGYPLGSCQLDRAGGAVFRGWNGLRGAASPEGQVTWAIAFTIAPTYFEPAEHQGIITPMLFDDALHERWRNRCRGIS